MGVKGLVLHQPRFIFSAFVNLELLQISDNGCDMTRFRSSRLTNSLNILSLTYEVLTTSQPDYLHNLISVQSSRSSASCSLLQLATASVIIISRTPVLLLGNRWRWSRQTTRNGSWVASRSVCMCVCVCLCVCLSVCLSVTVICYCLSYRQTR